MQARRPGEIRSAYVGVDHGTLYYEECGEGQPVILIHGHSLDHRMWDGQFADLARDYRVIRYDLRGYGLSSPQTEDFQFTHVEDLVALMDSLHIEKAHVVGLSLGGYIGADMLGWFPERMLSAFLASGNVRMSPGPSEPMDAEEAAQRDCEIAELKRKGVDETGMVRGADEIRRKPTRTDAQAALADDSGLGCLAAFTQGSPCRGGEGCFSAVENP